MFFFEHLNGILTRLLKSPYGVLEQIARKFEMLFTHNLSVANLSKNLKFEVKGKACQVDDRECFKKIANDRCFITSLAYGETIHNDYFIETTDEHFYTVRYFFFKENEIYFSGFKINQTSRFSVNVNSSIKLDFDYLLHARATNLTEERPASDIKHKVLFTNFYKSESSDFVDSSVGLIIRTYYHPFHN